MNRPACAFSAFLAAILFTTAAKSAQADSPVANSDENAAGVAWPFFAFDNGVGRDQGWLPPQQAKLTAELGFDGIGYSRVEDFDARYAACDANGQRIFSFYESFSVGKEDPISPTTLQHLPQLKGRDAILWINVQGSGTDDEAVAAFQKLADEAGKHGVRVAIYPHANTYVETSERTLRLAKAVGRKNFGMSINICHELKAGRGDDLIEIAKDSINHLFLVSINGADGVQDPARERGWARLIQPLGEGDFDLLLFLQQLRDSGYSGPIGLQCYQIPGKTDEILKKSMRAWRAMTAKINLAG